MKLSDGELSADANAVAEAALSAAQHQGARRLLDWIGVTHITTEQAVAALLRRDPDDPHYRLLDAHEQRWALAVARIAERSTRPGPTAADARAVAAARDRGVTWAAIASEFEISPQSVHGRYKAGAAARGGRRGPEPGAGSGPA